MIKLENKELAVSFDPDFGCKIHSFLHKETGFDLAAKDETGKKILGLLLCLALTAGLTEGFTTPAAAESWVTMPLEWTMNFRT